MSLREFLIGAKSVEHFSKVSGLPKGLLFAVSKNLENMFDRGVFRVKSGKILKETLIFSLLRVR
jgi:hypothetical protein